MRQIIRLNMPRDEHRSGILKRAKQQASELKFGRNSPSYIQLVPSCKSVVQIYFRYHNTHTQTHRQAINGELMNELLS